jgi:hypothetical protein
MALITSSNQTLTANQTGGTVFTPTSSIFTLCVFSGEVVLETRRNGSSTSWVPVFQDSQNTRGQAAPSLRALGAYVITTANGMDFRYVAGPAGAVVEANQ